MKRPLAVFGLLLPLLWSCASIPAPENPEQSLIVGYFVLDYPDGWFDEGRRTFSSGVNLYFTNQSTGNKFWLTTSKGYFCLLSNGTDSYTLDSYKLRVEGSFSNGDLNLRFTAKPHSVVYLGHYTLRLADPQKTTKTTPGGKATYWNYKRSLDSKYDEAAMVEYLRKADTAGLWLEYGVEHY